MIIGLHGRMGSGKNTVLDRLIDMSPPLRFGGLSFAEPLKRSVAALLDVSVEQLEEWKRNDLCYIKVEDMRALGGTVNGEHVCDGQIVAAPLTAREFLQRYGTEAHRDIFGQSFWVEQGMRRANEIIENSGRITTPVFTDVRFENEAKAIQIAGGEIWAINGPVNDTGDHASETPLPASLIDRYIDNTVRDDAFSGLDTQLRTILGELRVGSRNEANPDRPHGADVITRDLLRRTGAHDW